MISNKKKSSIKSLNKNSMPLFDNIEDQNNASNVSSKKYNNNSSIKSQNKSNLNTLNKNKQNPDSSKIEQGKPKHLTSLNSISDNRKNEQKNTISQRKPLTPKESQNKHLPFRSTLDTKTQTFSYSSGNISLGIYLQEARVKAGYSLNQVAMITKLNIHYIEAIERDDFKNTPPLIYIKAYVKKLATLYKIDVEKALTLLRPPENNDKQIPSKLIQELQETKQVNQKDEAKLKMIFQISTVTLLIAIVICLIIGLIYWLSSGSSNEHVQSNNINTSSASKVSNVSTNLKPITVTDKTEISKEMEKLIVPQSIKLTELPIPQK